MDRLPEQCCLHCAHADFRRSAQKGWYGWAVCARDDVCGSYRSPKAACDMGRFRLAENVEKRSAWWARIRQKGRTTP